jgi:hypothetical protein
MQHAPEQAVVVVIEIMIQIVFPQITPGGKDLQPVNRVLLFTTYLSADWYSNVAWCLRGKKNYQIDNNMRI